MKKLFLIFAAVAFACSGYAQAVYQIFDGATIAASVTNTSTTYANVRSTRMSSLTFRYKLMDAGSSDVTFDLDGSLDGATWVNNAFGSVAVTANGTTQVTGQTNIDVSAYILLRVRAENGNSVAVTNMYVTCGVKRGVEPTVPIAIAYGGTASTTAADARTALGVPAASAGSLANPTITGLATNSGLTASLPVFTDANKAFNSKSIANTKLALGIQSGTCITAADGTVTNTFATAFSAAPTVILTHLGLKLSPTNVVTTTTTTNFIMSAALGDVTNQWIAIGAP